MRYGALLVLCLALAACSDSKTPAASAPAASALAPPAAAQTSTAGSPEHELGRRIFNFRCYFCHGYSGDAKTLASTYLNPRPRDFNATEPDQLSRERMLESITHGRPGTAMRGFEGILKPAEIAAVTDFVRQEFMVSKAENTRYHTPENGWPDHQRYSSAFPFAKGTIAIDLPADQLTPEQRSGRKLFMASCVSCHDRATVRDPGAPWESRPLSFPRNGFVPGDDTAPKVDGVASATPYHLHDKAPLLPNLTPRERRGEMLFQNNCSFCHAADGTARNWIGSFLEPHPRDLTSDAAMNTMTRAHLAGVIREGLPGTSMPAWKAVLPDADIEAIVAYIDRAFHPLAPDGTPRAVKQAETK